MSRSAGLLLGFAADRLLGDPHRLHPVAGFGQLAARAEKSLYADSRAAGSAYAGLLVGSVAAAGVVADRLTRDRPIAKTLLTAAATWAVLGGRSLEREAEVMAGYLEEKDIVAARGRLGHLCSRDATDLEADELARATVESVAENTSDACVAPLLWGGVFGIPGLIGYRAVNTLDAMVGYKSARYLNFGWFAARLDDVLNLVPARACAVLTGYAAGRAGGDVADLAAGCAEAPESERGTGRGRVRGGARPAAGWDEHVRRRGRGPRLTRRRIAADGAGHPAYGVVGAASRVRRGAHRRDPGATPATYEGADMHLSQRPLRIALVRHGESEANLDKSIFERVPDHAIALTAHGVQQSAETGRRLREVFENEPVRVYVSPYLRALQTLGALGIDDLIGSTREEPRLREQDWANYQDTEDIEQQKKLRDSYGHFFYRFTHGESGSDVYDRVSSFLETMHRDFEAPDSPRNVLLISHGLTMRLFCMRWFHWSVRFFETLRNPDNAETRVLLRQPDFRYKLDRPFEQWTEYEPTERERSAWL
ncbi:cobalamin biosynthesis protein [Kribbella qitaiheensis]|nr:cobalamin biosynthesis protein [Kribbella qitaiheensis]